MKNVIIIPARLASTRLPNKVLLDLNGKSVIQRVYEASMKSQKADGVYIAVDNELVYDECKKFTNNVVMTKDTHQSGTDRIAEVAMELICENIVNVQGDEPFMEYELIDELFCELENNNQMVSAMHRLEQVQDLVNPNIVKVIVDKNSDSIYFSRSVIPHHRDEWDSLIHHHKIIPEPLNFYRHLGIYGYKRDFVLDITTYEPTYLERLEKLEQLRVLEHGHKIRMVKTNYNSIGIDTKEDYEKAKKIFEEQ